MVGAEIHWTPGVTLDDIELMVVERAYKHYQYNKVQTAKALGIVPKTLDTKLEAIRVREQKEADGVAQRAAKHAEFLMRQRGQVESKPIPGEQNVSNAEAWVRTQPALDTPAQQSMPMQQRPEIQKVLPRDAHRSGDSRRR